MLSKGIQSTLLGELNGQMSARLKEIAKTFKQAGFSVATSRNIDAWQKSHVALVMPIANAVYMAGGDNIQLAQMPEALHLMVRAMREGFQVLQALDIPITPAKLKLWAWLPESVLVALLSRWVKSKKFEILAAQHANAARDEMQKLTNEFQALALKASVATPAINQLESYIDLLGPEKIEFVRT